MSDWGMNIIVYSINRRNRIKQVKQIMLKQTIQGGDWNEDDQKNDMFIDDVYDSIECISM